jgi:hypothetical protein
MNEEIPSDGRRNLSQRGFKFVPIKILDSRQIALILHYGGGKIKGINISVNAHTKSKSPLINKKI